MVNKATATNDDLQQINRASRQVFDKVEQKKKERLSGNKVTRLDDFRSRGSGQVEIENQTGITTKEKVLFERIEQQKEAATGRKQRADLIGETQRDVLTGKSDVVDFLEYRKKKLGKIEKQTEEQEKPSIDILEEIETPVVATNEVKDEKTELDLVLERVSEKKTEELGGDSVFKEKLEKKMSEMIIDDNIRTEEDKTQEVAEFIEGNIETDEIQTEIEVKKIILEIKKIETEYPDEVRDARRENLAEKFETETRKLNTELTKEQEGLVKEKAKILADVFYGKEGVSNQSNSVLEDNNEGSVGKLKNSWMEVQAIVGLLNRKPDEANEIKENYKKINNGLRGIESPFKEVPQAAALDRVLNSLDDQKIGQAFGLVHSGNWLQRIRSLGNNSIIESAGGFVTTIGTQASRSFVQNSVGILTSGNFYAGFKNILSGMLNGGVKALSGAGGLAKTLGVAAGASNPVGWMAMGGKALLGKIFGGLKGLGLDLLGKSKNGLESGGSKALGWLMGGLGAVGSIGGLIAAMAPQVIVVILVSVLGISFLTMSYTQNQSPTVPPTVSEPETNPVNDPNVDPESEGVTGGSCAGGTLNIGNIYEPINMDGIKKRVKASEYKYKSNGNIDFACINGLLPQKGTRQRSDIIKAAYALLGVPYFMTGGHGTIADGVSSKWGNKITATCSYGNCGRKYLGLDCSGFVRWVYKYVTGEVVGNRARDIYSRSQKINKSELLPGDIGFISGDHIGIFFGKGTDGKYYFIHSAGRSSHVGPQGLGGVWISPYNFKQFGRIKVNLN